MLWGIGGESQYLVVELFAAPDVGVRWKTRLRPGAARPPAIRRPGCPVAHHPVAPRGRSPLPISKLSYLLPVCPTLLFF